MSPRLIAAVTVAALVFAATPSCAQDSDGSFASETRFMEKDGEAIFKNICAACHMPNGQGAAGAGAYPALAGNRKLETAAYPVFMVVNGRNAMPSFANRLDDNQIAAVVNYVRTHFDNDYKDAVSPADVKAVRQ
jgi:mono/diheme cytochrome c family protein